MPLDAKQLLHRDDAMLAMDDRIVLDSVLTADERAMFRGTPFTAPAIALILLFATFLLTVVSVRYLQGWQRDRAAVEQLQRAFGEIIARVPTATVAEMTSFARQWQIYTHETLKAERSSPVFEQIRRDAGTAIVQRAVRLLEVPDYLEVQESVVLASTIQSIATTPVMMSDYLLKSPTVHDVLLATVERGTQAILYWGRPDASPIELQQARMVATHLAAVVPSERRADFDRVATVLAAREAALQQIAKRMTTESPSSDAVPQTPTQQR